MDETTILILSMTFGFINYSLIAKWYLIPYLSSIPRQQAFVPLLFVHCFRYIGMAFLITGIVSPDLSPLFAYPAAYGDLFAAILALFAIIALRCNLSISLALVWIFNIVGSLDFLYAIVQGLRLTAPHQLGATYFIPIIVVPALLLSHYIIFKLLIQGEVNS